MQSIRIGLIVPSSNSTMETEIPAMFRTREAIAPERFTFHSSRMRMRSVSKDELAAMDEQSERCAAELADVRVSVAGYACLVAIMSQGHGYHRRSQERLSRVFAENGGDGAVVNSAGALIDCIKQLGARRVTAIMPYSAPLARTVVDYIEAEGISVKDYRTLEVTDNFAVGQLDPARLPEIARTLDTRGIDVFIASACVQMPSLAAIPAIERALGIPTISAAVCTTHAMLTALGLPAVVPNAGALLAATPTASALSPKPVLGAPA
jgi:maleate isomerase